MATRRLNEAMIAGFTIGKAAEFGRQLVMATDPKFSKQMGEKWGVKPEILQEWASGYIAFDTVISTMGVVSILQAIRKNRKGAGQAGRIQGGALLGYTVYYLLYTLIALRKGKASNRLFDLAFLLVHAWAGYSIFKFAQKAVHPADSK